MSSLALRLERSPLHQLTLARFREFTREKEMIFWTFVFPILMAVGLGIAFRNKGPDKVQIGVVDGPQAATLTRALGAEADVVVKRLEPGQVDEALRKGDVALVLEPAARVAAGVTGATAGAAAGAGQAAGATAGAAAGTTAGSATAATLAGGTVYRFDPTRPESRVAQLAANEALARAAGQPPVRPAHLEKVTERGSRYIDFLIPGLLGMNLLGTGLWGVGFALVRMRTGKLLKRLQATPMRRTHFLLSFMLARLAFLAIELTVLLGFARFAFDVVVNGSLVALFLVAALGALTFSGLGLLVASRARTQEGVMGLMNVVSLPMWILSGVFFSADRFPAVLQPLIRALPLTAIVDALRAIMIDGTALTALALPIGIAAAWGFASYGAALAIFRWR
jgi:ABC-2 type transport system permease protein